MRQFDVPLFYRGPIISTVKEALLSPEHIRHYDFHAKTIRETDAWLPGTRTVEAALCLSR